MQINSFNNINILDLSINGKLDPVNARLFNKITDQISNEYVESINALSLKQVENITSSVVNVKELRKTVEQDAKTFGLLVNEAALERESGVVSTNKQMVTKQSFR